MKLGIDTAFNRVNDAGGVEGRMLKLIAADDGFEPTRTADAMKQLYEKDQVLGMIGNVGTATAAVALPYALDGGSALRRLHQAVNIRHDLDPYVFLSGRAEDRPRYAILSKCAGYHPGRSAFFASRMRRRCGFAGGKVISLARHGKSGILRLNYLRNTVDVDDAVNQLKARGCPSGGGHDFSLSHRREIHRDFRDLFPGILYSNISFVGSTVLAGD